MKADFSTIEAMKRRYMEANKQLEDAICLLPVAAESMAKAERDYRVEKAKATLSLKADGNPATLIQNLVNGETADIRLKWKCAESDWNACRENIRRLHKNIDTCQSLLSTEKAMMGIK